MIKKTPILDVLTVMFFVAVPITIVVLGIWIAIMYWLGI
jgi:hypothetical protein